MSTTRFLPALACICISLAAGAAPEPTAGLPANAAALALEVELARGPGLYLLVDTGREVVEVKARGIVLDRVTLRRAAVLVPGPLLGGGRRPDLELPAVWRVAEPPVDLERRVVAPETLEPYSEEAAHSEPASPTATPTPVSGVRHARFGVLTDAGWRVEMGPGVAAAGFLHRLGDGLKHLWFRIVRSDDPRPPVLALDLAPEGADRLHHLMREGTALLVVPPPGA